MNAPPVPLAGVCALFKLDPKAVTKLPTSPGNYRVRVPGAWLSRGFPEGTGRDPGQMGGPGGEAGLATGGRAWCRAGRGLGAVGGAWSRTEQVGRGPERGSGSRVGGEWGKRVGRVAGGPGADGRAWRRGGASNPASRPPCSPERGRQVALRRLLSCAGQVLRGRANSLKGSPAVASRVRKVQHCQQPTVWVQARPLCGGDDIFYLGLPWSLHCRPECYPGASPPRCGFRRYLSAT